ncbi:hypothetical protein RRG08_063858, partial [Elysia crispata]
SSKEMAQNKDATAAQTVPSSQISESTKPDLWSPDPENETVQKRERETIQVEALQPGGDLGAPSSEQGWNTRPD